MPPSRLPRHAAADAPRRRSTLLPALLLSTMALAFGGLAVLPSGGLASVRVTAASATAPLITELGAPTSDEYDTLYGIPDNPVPKAAPATPRAADRASRTRRADASTLPDESVSDGTYVRPNLGRLTSTFKWRWGRMHTGIDLAAAYGTPVRAVTEGTIVEAGQESGYGNIVKIRHPDGAVTYYAHLSRILVYSGHVNAGEVIAREGNTGHSTGPHLHFEVRYNDAPINPIPWLRKHGIYI